MNECPLPPPILVLRDVYKSRSPGQPAELHDMRSEVQVPEAKFKKIKIRHIFFYKNVVAVLAMGVGRTIL